MSWDIEWKGLDLIVRGTFYASDGAEPACVNIDSIAPRSRPQVELMQYLNEAALESIEAQILEPTVDED